VLAMLKSGLFQRYCLWCLLAQSAFRASVKATLVQVSVDSTGASHGHSSSRTHRSRLLRSSAGREEREHYDLLIVIPASAERDQQRMDAVRETWTLDIDPETHQCARCQSNRTVKYLFLLGNEAADEAPEKDVAILRRCSSDYDHLAHKVRQGIRYAVTHYSFHLLLKADTDSWIFLDRLIDFAEGHRLFSRSGVHAGEIRRRGKPQTYAGAQNRDEVFSQLTSQDTYPVYTPGCGYLLTRDLCNYISLLSEDQGGKDKSGSGMQDSTLPGLTELPQEDVAVGFWLEAVEHQRLSMPLSIFGDACRKSDGDSYVLDHYVSKEQMRQRWRNLQQSGDPCREEAAL